MRIKPSLLREIDVSVRLALGADADTIKYEVQDEGKTLFVQVEPKEGADVSAMAKAVAEVLPRFLPPIPDDYARSVVFERGERLIETVLSPLG